MCQGLWHFWKCAAKHKCTTAKWKLCSGITNACLQIGWGFTFLLNYQLKRFRQRQRREKKIVVWFLCLWRPRFLAHTVASLLRKNSTTQGPFYQHAWSNFSSNFFLIEKFKAFFGKRNETLQEACQTGGPRAACGPN